MHLLRKCQHKNHLTVSTSPLVCLPLQLPLVFTSPGKSTWKMFTLKSQQVHHSCASTPWGIHMEKWPTFICARISSFLEQDHMKIIGFKSEKKQDFSISVKAWIEKTSTCCVSMRRLSFLVKVFLVKRSTIRSWGLSISIWASNLEKNIFALLKSESKPNEIHSECRKPYAKASTALEQIELLTLWTLIQWESCIIWNIFFCISQLCKSQPYIEICSLLIYWCKLGQFHCVNAGHLVPKPM